MFSKLDIYVFIIPETCRVHLIRYLFLLFQKLVMFIKLDIYVFIIPEMCRVHLIRYLYFYYSRNVSCSLNKISMYLLFQKLVMFT